jgi:HD-like signal output (HDOD) protein
MNIDPALRALNIDLPASPYTLVKLSLLIGSEGTAVSDMASLIQSDMALASAIVRTVNSAKFGLPKQVETVHEAVRYLGTSEVAGMTYEMGLRAAFPPSPLIEPIWDRAGRRGRLMGRLARELGVDQWVAHTAGLFAEAGRAVLLAHDSERYISLNRLAVNEAAEVAAEVSAFGVSHAALGAALCESWGLARTVSAYIRARVTPVPEWAGEVLDVRRFLVLGAEVDAALSAAAPTLEQREAQRIEHAALAEFKLTDLQEQAERVLRNIA